jgi:hypothetical protein
MLQGMSLLWRTPRTASRFPSHRALSSARIVRTWERVSCRRSRRGCYDLLAQRDPNRTGERPCPKVTAKRKSRGRTKRNRRLPPLGRTAENRRRPRVESGHDGGVKAAVWRASLCSSRFVAAGPGHVRAGGRRRRASGAPARRHWAISFRSAGRRAGGVELRPLCAHPREVRPPTR